MSEFVIDVDTEHFDQEILQQGLPVLVDFWAPWCGPCKQLTPIIDQIAKDYGPQLKVCKVNVDSSPELATKYGVRSIPTLILLKNGQQIATQVGQITYRELETFIKQVIENNDP